MNNKSEHTPRKMALKAGELRRWHYKDSVAPFSFPLDTDGRNLTIVCVGTDACTGDSFGPMVGSYLKGLGVERVYGTLNDPIHASNLEVEMPKIKEMHPNDCIVGVDAAVGPSVSYIVLKNEPLRPGIGCGKVWLPKVGEYCLFGVTSRKGWHELNTTRLGLVHSMALSTVNFLLSSVPNLINWDKGLLEVAAGLFQN